VKPWAVPDGHPDPFAAEGCVSTLPKAEYSYSPRLALALRFDPAGRADELPDLVTKATREKLRRVSAQAILRLAARQDVNRSLFADPEQEYNEAVQFYKHDVDWSSRLILGDSRPHWPARSNRAATWPKAATSVSSGWGGMGLPGGGRQVVDLAVRLSMSSGSLLRTSIPVSNRNA